MMISTLPNTLQLSNDITPCFPIQLCCNCGTTTNLQVLEQETYFTIYRLIYSNLTFSLAPPFCPKCAPSAQRRPKKILHYALRLALAFTLTASVFIITNRYLIDLSILGDNIIPIAFIIAITAATGRASLTKSRRKQTSYYQPARVINVTQATPAAPIININLCSLTKIMKMSLLQ